VVASLKPRIVRFDAPWAWLQAGWRDLWQQPLLSLGYGAAFATAAAAIALGLAQLEVHALFLALAGGFMLLGPLAAGGLYEISRRLGHGLPVSFADMIGAGYASRGQLLFFGGLLTFAFMLWIRVAVLLLALFLGSTVLPPPSQFMQLLLFTPSGLGLLIVGSLVGGIIAIAIFALSAVAIPMLLDRPIDFVTAAVASVRAVTANPKPMALWAALIAVLMAAGFATILAGLVIAFPLIGHATWHAYVDLYGAQSDV
jgi:uncharacterized membrane protein